MANAYSGTLEADDSQFFEPGQSYRLLIAPQISQSYLRRANQYQGEGFGIGAGDLLLTNLIVQPPLGMHLGIWYDVSGCLGMSMAETPSPLATVRWATADRIELVGDRRLAYGVYIGDEDQGGPMIVIESAYWLHPTVVSHEVVHAFGYGEGAAEILRCVMNVPGELPERYASDEW
jgi:hypothetical protein